MFWKREASDVLFLISQELNSLFLPSGNGFLILVTPPPASTPGRINAASKSCQLPEGTRLLELPAGPRGLTHCPAKAAAKKWFME